jgi:hypothetical protein
MLLPDRLRARICYTMLLPDGLRAKTCCRKLLPDGLRARACCRRIARRVEDRDLLQEAVARQDSLQEVDARRRQTK